MYLIWDNLVALIIAGTVVLLLASIQMRGQDAAIETRQFESMKSAQHRLTAVIEQDFKNIGSGYLLSGAGAQLAIDTTSEVRTFSFNARTDPANKEAQRVTYRWEEVDEVELRSGDMVPVIRLERQAGNSAPWTTLSHRSITDLGITLRNENLSVIQSNSAETLSRTKRIDVSLRMISPLGTGNTFEVITWNKRIRPPNLQRDENNFLLIGPS